MLYENYILQEFDNRELPRLKAGASCKFTFSTDAFLKQAPDHYAFKVRLTGDVDTQPNWMWEGGYPRLYRLIDDSLSTETKESQFSLKLKLNHEDYPRRAWVHIPCPPRLTPQFPVLPCDGRWDFSVLVKAQDLEIESEGRVCFVLEKHLKKPGVDPRDISGEPDEVTVVEFPQGSYDFTRFSTSITIDEDTASLLVYAVAQHAGGTVWLENPQLLNERGDNILPQFTVSNPFHEYLNWMGENLSRKDWTDIEATLNGETFFVGELFQRCHRFSENEIAIPANLMRQGENTLELRNVDDYFSPIPYRVKKVEILYGACEEIGIVSCPSLVYANAPFGVLVQVKTAGAPITVSSSSPEIAPVKPELSFPAAGLSIIPFTAKGPCTDVTVTVTCQGVTQTAQIQRVIEKTADNVLTGTGDAIYVPQDVQQTEEFLAWYLHNELGNFITFRPTYRWCGTRMLNPKVWERIVELCTQYGIHYCHMIDGRELPGANANPSKAMLQSEWFVGNQGHEHDGAYYYWGPGRIQDENEIFFSTLQSKIVKHPDFTYYHAPIFTEDGHIFGHYNPIDTKDMKEAAGHFVDNCRRDLAGIHRHTGPSTLFKYFFEAGLPVGGAELMYGPHEVVLSALRGASLAYHRQEYASHLAVQWSSTPHDSPAKYRRYQLALYVCYLQGTHHINTEEGLWRIEEYFSDYDRFGDVCRSYQKVQADFNHFVKAHSRRGKMVNPVALLHGQYDGWVCFTRQNAWAHLGDDWKFDTPEESWDLIKVFYPDSVMDSLYLHPCENKPQGFYSRTPYGTVDVLPVEAEGKLMDTYSAAAFLGWNTAEPGQLEKLAAYVNQGGTLLLGWPHLFTDTNRVSAIHGEPTLVDARLIRELAGITFQGFVKAQTAQGETVTLGNVQLQDSVAVRSTLDGIPLVLEHPIGNGRVLFVNAREYPAAPGVREIYESLLREIGETGVASQAQRGWMVTRDTVDTGVFDREDGLRDIYAININWWSDVNVPAKAQLLFGGHTIPVSIDREILHVITLGNRFGVWCSDNDTDILSIRETPGAVEITLQGYGCTNLRLISLDPIQSGDVPIVSCGESLYRTTVELSGVRTLRFQK